MNTVTGVILFNCFRNLNNFCVTEMDADYIAMSDISNDGLGGVRGRVSSFDVNPLHKRRANRIHK